ncbi:MAG: SCO family protein [Pyrinomonadaceae bacterium]|nr:SCO family protein [Pyrinomonadaceae bacterium]
MQGGYYAGPPEVGRQDGNVPNPLQNVGIDQRLNEQLPLDAVFRDENGQQVKLGQYFSHGKPVILSLVYYECPMLCNQVLIGLVGSLKALTFDVGKEFEVLTVSFDPRETPGLARQKKSTFLTRYDRPSAPAAAGWHFLTGDENSIKRLTEAVGFRYAYDPTTNQFAHASAVMVATPEGRLSHYFYGIEYAPKEIRLGLIEASDNKIGSPVDRLLLYCYHYDPATGKYGARVMNILRLGGVIFLIGFAAMLFVLIRWKPHAGEMERPTTSEVGGTA